MAVKIVEAPPKTYCAHCNKCGATFTYEIDDVHRNYLRGGEGIYCPSCAEWCRHTTQSFTGRCC
jgi:hypothetical protein